METIICSQCGVAFLIPADLHTKLLENKETFYCPNGHSLHFLGKTAEQEIKDLKARLAEKDEEIKRLEQSQTDWRNECDICHKKVFHLSAHKKRMHS